MADKNYMELAGETFEPYDPNKPLFTWKPDWSRTKEYLKSIIPGANAVDFYANNPDAPISETLSLLAEDFVPFYGNIKNDGDASDFITEAALMSIPGGKAGAMKRRNKLTSKNRLFTDIEGTYPGKPVTGASDYFLHEEIAPGKFDNGVSAPNHNREVTPAERKTMLDELDKSIAAHEKMPMRKEAAYTPIDYNNKTYSPEEFYDKYFDVEWEIGKLEKKRSLTTAEYNKLNKLKQTKKKMEIAEALSNDSGLGSFIKDPSNISKNNEQFYGPYLDDVIEDFGHAAEGKNGYKW